MKYTVDEIINDVVTLIGEDESKKYENINNFSFNIKENDMVVFENNTYEKVSNDEVINRIKNKMEMLRSNE